MASLNHPVLFEINKYLGRKPKLVEYHVLKQQYLKVLKVNTFNTELFFFLVKKNKNMFFKDLIMPDEEIKKRIDSYFTKQYHAKRLGTMLAILELQKILVFTYTKILGVLTTQIPEYYNSTIRLNYTDMEAIAEIIISAYNIAPPREKCMGRHNISDLVSHVHSIIEEYLRRHNTSCICYGSYSLHLLNKNIEYGDIDMLQTNARTFLINMAFLIRFITGRYVVLLKVPFLKNYVVMHDEEQKHVMDTFSIRESTMMLIPKIMIDNMYIIDPGIQLLNNIKMFSQIDRLEDIHDKFHKLTIRLGTLLEYTRYRYSIPLDIQSTINVTTKINTATRVIIIDLKKYKLNYNKCCCFLDENELKNVANKVRHPDDYIDLEALANSAFLVNNKTLYTYFSNTTLMKSETEIHPITLNALISHVLLYHIITNKRYDSLLGDLFRTLLSIEKVPIFRIIPRDKKIGKHTVINIEKDVIFH